MSALSPFSLSYQNRGFTLLELLVAISLSTILMTVLVTGLNVIARDWHKQGSNLDNKLDQSLVLLQIEKAIIGTYPYYFKETSVAKQELYFTGTKDEVSWVSTVSPDQSSGLKLWHLKKNNDGGFNLNLVNVYPGSLKKQLEKQQNEDDEKSLYLSDYEVSFHFLTENSQKLKQWQTRWDAKKEETLPIGVRVDFNSKLDEEGEVTFSVFGFIRSGQTNSKKKQVDADSPFGFGNKQAPVKTNNTGNKKGLF